MYEFLIVTFWKWSTVCNDYEFYSNTQNFCIFLQFTDFSVFYISKTIEVNNLKQALKVPHISHVYPLYVPDLLPDCGARENC